MTPVDAQDTWSVWPPHVDAAINFGGFRFDLQPPPSHPEGPYFLAEVRAGFYWNAHLKTEVARAWLETNGRVSGQEAPHTLTDWYDSLIVDTPSYGQRVDLAHNYRRDRWSVAQLYQFRPGRTLQPYVGAAIGIDSETDFDSRDDSFFPPLTDPERLFYTRARIKISETDILPRDFPPPVTTTHVHAFGKFGVKVFVPRRVFLLIEAQVGSRVSPLAFGIGVDLF